MDKLKRDNFEFGGENFCLGEEVIISHRSPGYPNGIRKYMGVIEYISPETKTLDGLRTDIKLDSCKQMMGLKYIEKIEKATNENKEKFYKSEEELKKKLNTKYKKVEIFLKEVDDESEYVITCDNKKMGSGDTLQEAIANFDKIIKGNSQ